MERYWIGELGLKAPPIPEGPPAREMHPEPSRLGPEDVAALRACGPGTVSTTPTDRIAYSYGRSHDELLAFLHRRPSPVTDGVAIPRSSEELQRILACASARKIAIVPWGGGTTTVGGVLPLRGRHRAVVTLLLGYLNRPLGIDLASGTARFEAGIRGPDMAQYLARRGLTLGHFPHSFEFSTLGGWIATASSGQALSQYGGILERVSWARWATPQGFIEWQDGTPGPAAVEPRLLLASEGTLGVMVEVGLYLSSAPEHTEVRAALFPSWESGLGVLRVLVSDDPRPSLARISDPAESRFLLTLARAGRPPETLRGLEGFAIRRKIADLRSVVFGLVSFEGTRRRTGQGTYVLDELMRQAGGIALPGGTWPGLGDAWQSSRFRGPALRDDLVPDGWAFETIEASAPWESATGIARSVREAIPAALATHGARGEVYVQANRPTRASVGLSFTIIYPEPKVRSEETWRSAREAVLDSVAAGGGYPPRPGGLGTAYRSRAGGFLSAEAIAQMTAFKRTVDPQGILNPGKLLPAGLPSPDALAEEPDPDAIS